MKGYEELLDCTIGIIPSSKLCLDLTRFNLSYMKKFIPLFKCSMLNLNDNICTIKEGYNNKFDANTKLDELNDGLRNIVYRFEDIKLLKELYCILKLVPKEIQLRGVLDLQRLCCNQMGYLSLRVKDDIHYDSGLYSSCLATIDLNLGPNPIEWVVVDSKDYQALKALIGTDPLDNSKFWDYSLDRLIANGITANIQIQRTGDIVLPFMTI